MVEEEREKVDNKNSKRKRKWKIFARIICLLGTLFWLFIFIKILQTGYLTWIGITVATLILVPALLSSIFGFAGKKQIGKLLSFFFLGEIALIIIIEGIILILPMDNHIWKPYKNDKKIVLFEEKQTVPDEENAAIRYKSLFAAIDMNDCPDSLFKKNGHIRDEILLHPWKSSDYPEISKWLDSHTETLEELLRISKIDKCNWATEIDVNNECKVPYKPFRYCLRLIVTTANRDLGEGRIHMAMEKSFCLFGISEHMYQQTNKQDFMSGFYPERQAMRIIKYTLVNNHLSQEDIDQITNNLPTAENNWHRDITKLLEPEKIRFVNIMAAQYEINEKGQVRFSTESSTLFLNKYMWEHPKRTDRLRRLYRLMNMPLDPNDLWDMADVEAADFLHFLEQDSKADTYSLFEGFPFKSLCNVARWSAQAICFDKLLYPILKKGYMSNILLRHGTRLILGLRKYKNIHGTWPPDLDSIKSATPAEAFIDPVTENPLKYENHGETFSLYGETIKIWPE